MDINLDIFSWVLFLSYQPGLASRQEWVSHYIA